MARTAKSIVNAKGVASITLPIDGEPRTLKLKMTLGAMAELEDAFECDFADLELHLTSTKNIARFIAELARAGGEVLSEEQVAQIRKAPIEVADLMAAIAGVADTGAAPASDAESAAKK